MGNHLVWSSFSPSLYKWLDEDTKKLAVQEVLEFKFSDAHLHVFSIYYSILLETK